mgnify:CR=1 FL=1
MVESASELLDYFRVVWKRKILIIIVVIVCIVVGIGIEIGIGEKNSRYKPEVTYQARALVKIGKKAVLSTPPTDIVPTTGITSSLVYLDSPGELAVTIPVRYGDKVNNQLGYQLEVRQFGELVSMVEIIMKGPDRGVERVLKEVVDMLIDEHSIMVKDSVFVYRNFMKVMEADAEMLKKDIFVIDKSIKEMKRKEGEYLVSIETNAAVKSEDRTGGDRSAFLNMLYLKTIDRERDLSNSRSALRKIQQQLSIHRITLGNLEEYKTKLVGEVKSAALKPDEAKSSKQKIMLAGIASLIMALFIAFFVEYIEESKLRRKGKLQG